MATLPDPDEPALPTTSCPRCACVVITTLALDDAGALQLRCIRCDQPLDPIGGAYTALSNLDAMGYDVGAPEARRDGHGGCRGGQCGVRQPSAS